VPVLGGLFSYQQFRSVRRELFVILRPQIISGDDRDSEYMRQFRQSFQNITSLLEEAGL
jgi:type II secretory pathway component GspD/PulD (secretin)